MLFEGVVFVFAAIVITAIFSAGQAMMAPNRDFLSNGTCQNIWFIEGLPLGDFVLLTLPFNGFARIAKKIPLMFIAIKK